MAEEKSLSPKEELQRLTMICAKAKVPVSVKGLVNGVMVTMEVSGRKKDWGSGISYKSNAEVNEDEAYKQLLPVFKQQMQKVLKKAERTLRKARFKVR